MDEAIETSPELRKEWSKPELRQLDIEKITALNSGTGSDGGGSGHSKQS
jgi:hypothetical protein